MTIDFGLGLPFGPPAGQIEQWINTLDASLPKLGKHFRSLWMTDHFFWKDQPTYEALTALTYLAARFPEYEIGPMVLGQNYRNPAHLAQMAATLQALTHGRFILGIGAGWKEDEYRAFNFRFPTPGERIEQLEDTLVILKKMWTQAGQISYVGKHYSVTDAWCEPKPNPVPPIMVGGSGTKTMLLTAKYADWWNMSDVNKAGYSERLAILKQHCTTIGRDPASLRLTWFGRMAVGKTQAEAEGYANSREIKYSTQNAFVGTPSQVVEQLQEFIALGVSYFMVDLIGLPNADVIEMVTEEVISKVRS